MRTYDLWPSIASGFLYLIVFEANPCSIGAAVYVGEACSEICLQPCFNIGMRCWNHAWIAVCQSVALLIAAAKRSGRMSQPKPAPRLARVEQQHLKGS